MLMSPCQKRTWQRDAKLSSIQVIMLQYCDLLICSVELLHYILYEPLGTFVGTTRALEATFMPVQLSRLITESAVLVYFKHPRSPMARAPDNACAKSECF